jgi:hypothetical protein
MTPRAIAWLIYGFFLLFWWFAAIAALIHYRLDRSRRAPALIHVERTLGIQIPVRLYVTIVWVAAGLVTLGSLWIPRVWTPIIERILHATPTV